MDASESRQHPKDETASLSRRSFITGTAAAGAMLPSTSLAVATMAASGSLVMKSAEPWAAHPKAAVVTEQRGEQFAANANGTRSCSGGWHWVYDGVSPGQSYDITIEVSHQGLATPMDMLRCFAVWGKVRPDQSNLRGIHDSILPKQISADRIRFSRRVTAPDDAKLLTIRAILRWTAAGATTWQVPHITPAAEPLVQRAPVRVCVVTGDATQRRNRQFKAIQDNIDFYGEL